ncbi:MAG: type II toxin-antitoxin system PemK/MazF family toxin [Anaerolineaceae bacterium]
MEIHQGDIFWVQPSDGEETGHPHPFVILQENVFNRSRLTRVIVCAITSNLQRASLPGNLLLDDGEANLPKRSVVEVAKISSIRRQQLGDYIGTITPQRVQQVLDGMQFLHTLTENRPAKPSGGALPL